MAKKNMTPTERREAIIDALYIRREEKCENLASEFGVSVRTIKNDIAELSLTHPIETVRGRYSGGIKITDGCYRNRRKLNQKQKNLLEKLQTGLTGDDLAVMNSILREFAV